jgi:hypothetical protein
MTFTETAPPAPVDKTAANDEAGRKKVAEDAAHLAVALAHNAGIGVRSLYAEMQAARGSFSHPRTDAGLARLGAALLRVDGPRRSQKLYLDGGKLAPEILANVPLERRPIVAAARHPEPPVSSSVPPEGKCPGTVPRDTPSERPVCNARPPMGGRGTGHSLEHEEALNGECPGSRDGGTVDEPDEAIGVAS